jgi:hypothetical protein
MFTRMLEEVVSVARRRARRGPGPPPPRLGPPADCDDLVCGLCSVRATARLSRIASTVAPAATRGREDGGREDRR